MKAVLFKTGGILIVIGAVLPIFLPDVAPFVFTVGALLFAPIQINDIYEGKNLIIRRLRRQQVFGAMMLLVTATLMLTQHFDLPPFRGAEWEITLLIAVVLEVYTVFRIDHEQQKEQQ